MIVVQKVPCEIRGKVGGFSGSFSYWSLISVILKNRL